MHAHAVDPRARTRMTIVLAAAVVATTATLAGVVTGQKLGIVRVGAPSIESILVMPLDVGATPLAPPPPPAAPTQTAAAAPSDPETPPVRDDLPPLETARAKSSTHGPTTGKGTDVGSITGRDVIGSLHGSPCPVPGTCAKVPSVARPPTTPTPEPRGFAPISALREVAKYSPDPPREQLARTAAGQRGRSGSSTVAFCIDAAGKITSTRTRRSAGDHEVDRICRETVARWRFDPFRVDGRPRATCSEVTFQIAFE